MAKDVKTGGRQKGTPNKTTTQLKSMVADFINMNWDQVQKDFKSRRMHPRDRLAFLEKLLKYAVPIMNNTDGVFDFKPGLEKMSEEDLQRLAELIIQSSQSNVTEES